MKKIHPEILRLIYAILAVMAATAFIKYMIKQMVSGG